MRPYILLRIASILMFIHALAHTVGHHGWKSGQNDTQRQVIGAMSSHFFPFMGVSRSMGDYFEGYGYACSLALILFAYILWVSARETGTYHKKILAGISLCLCIWALVEFIYFFPVAALITLGAGFLSLLALILPKKTGEPTYSHDR